MFTWLYGFWVWVSAPGVRPFLGALAAAVAALTIDPANWMRPLRALRRFIQVVVVWLVVVWLFGLLPYANGEGFGYGRGRGQDGTGTHRGSGPGDGIRPELLPHPRVTVVSGQTRGMPENVVLQIRWVPHPADPEQPVEYACDVVLRDAVHQVRANNIDEFTEALTSVLRQVSVPEGVQNPLASVRQTPFPGTGVLERVEALIRRALPNVGLERDDRP